MISIGCSELKKIVKSGISSDDLNTRYDYSRVTDMSYLFAGENRLEEIPFLITSNVRNMSGMFFDCHSLLSVGRMDVSNVIATDHIFHNCFCLGEFNPYDFPGFNFSRLSNPWVQLYYPELCL